MYLVLVLLLSGFYFFFFTVPAPTSIYTLSLHDALPICQGSVGHPAAVRVVQRARDLLEDPHTGRELERSTGLRSEEHTSELQSPDHLVCRLLLEKKKKNSKEHTSSQLITSITPSA